MVNRVVDAGGAARGAGSLTAPIHRWTLSPGAFYVFMTGWASALAALSYVSLCREDRGAVMESCRTLLQHCAGEASSALAAGDLVRVRSLARRLGGKPNTWYAAGADGDGKVLSAAGAPVPPSVPIPDGGQTVVVRPARTWPAREGSQTVWSGDQPWGVLRWGVQTREAHKKQRFTMAASYPRGLGRLLWAGS